MGSFFDSDEMNISSGIFPSNSSNYGYHVSTVSVNIFIVLILQFITLVFVVPTNSYVIWLIVRGTRNGLAAELSCLNICICEMLICLGYVLMFIPYLNTVLYYGQAITMVARPLFHCLICVERYLAVVHPLTFMKYRHLRYKVICCVFAWTVIFAFCGVLFLIYSDSILFLFWGLALYIFFLSIMLFCGAAVLRALKRSGPGERNTEGEEEYRMKRRAFKVILIVTVTMFIIYAPIIIQIFLFLGAVDVLGVFLYISLCTNSLCSVVFPLLFLYRVGKLSCIKCPFRCIMFSFLEELVHS